MTEICPTEQFERLEEGEKTELAEILGILNGKKTAEFISPEVLALAYYMKIRLGNTKGGDLLCSLTQEHRDLKRQEQHLQILRELLSVALTKSDIKTQLALALEIITTQDCLLSVINMGAIFLFNENGELEMATARNLPEERKICCAVLKLGECLCGKAAEKKTLIHTPDVCQDDRHKPMCEEGERHGHYTVPIISKEKLLGVLSLYLPQGQERDAEEEEHLHAVANILASLILAEENDVLGALPGVTNFSTKFTGLDGSQKWARLLASMCPNPNAVITGLEELLVNAVEHGIAGITYDEKKRFKRDILLLGNAQAWRQEVDQRLKMLQNIGKVVSVHFKRTKDYIKITITDPGKGFEWKAYFDTVEERITDLNGKGISAGAVGCFRRENVEFNDKGNSVTVTIPIQNKRKDMFRIPKKKE